MATHADQALALIADPTRDETELLGAFRYTRILAAPSLDPISCRNAVQPGRAGTVSVRAMRPLMLLHHLLDELFAKHPGHVTVVSHTQPVATAPSRDPAS